MSTAGRTQAIGTVSAVLTRPPVQGSLAPSQNPLAPDNLFGIGGNLKNRAENALI